MPFLKSPFTSGGGGGSEDTVSVYNAMLDQKETALFQKGGGLSAADYDQLISMAQGFVGRLDTPSKRASMQSKISQLQLAKIKVQNDVSDVNSLGNQVEDSYRKATLSALNDPQQFVLDRIVTLQDAQKTLLGRLGDMESSDANYANFSSAVYDYQSQIETWQSALESYNKGEKSALQAYFYTDPSTGKPLYGEYVPAGMSPKYVKNARTTNRTIDGIPVNLVPNLKTPGQIGANWMGKKLQTPGISDIGYYDQTTGVWVPPPSLTSQEDSPDGNPVDTSSKNFSATPYIPSGHFAVGTDGKTLYENINGDGYRKYVNTNFGDLGVLSPIPLPQVWENRINSKVINSFDPTNPQMPQGMNVKFVGPQPLNLQGSEPDVQGGQANPQEAAPLPAAGPINPKAIQQPHGAELQGKKIDMIVKSSNLA